MLEYLFVCLFLYVVNNPHTNARDARDVGALPGSGRSPGKGYGNQPRYTCLEDSID